MNLQPVLRLVLPVLTMIVLLLTTNTLLKKIQFQQQNQMTESLLDYSEDVSQQLSSALKEAKSTNVSNCSEESMNILRNIRRKYLYVDDIGLISNGHVICTADWGYLINRIDLPSEWYTTPGGYRIYKSWPDINYAKSRQTVTVRGDFIVFNSALSFTDFLKTQPSYFIKLTTKNKRVLFYSKGVEIIPEDRFLYKPFIVKTLNCSRLRDLCVSTSRIDGGLLSLHWFLTTMLLVLGILCGILLTSWICNHITARKSLEARLIRAIRRRELSMEYQPIVNKNCRITGVEALVRWNDSYFGSVSPELFIGIAEQLGIYRSITEFVTLRSLTEMGPYLIKHPDITLSLNVCDEEINESDYLESLNKECIIRGISNTQIKIEITERSRSENSIISSFCTSARKLGFLVSLDDFGTGLCNILWLTELDFDEVKIDKFLVQNITKKGKRKMLLSMIDGLKKTNRKLVFEGIETKEQFDFIRNIDAKVYIQGWYVSRSKRIDEVNEMLNNLAIDKLY